MQVQERFLIVLLPILKEPEYGRGYILSALIPVYVGDYKLVGILTEEAIPEIAWIGHTKKVGRIATVVDDVQF
jgi:hypothetical protein